MGSVWIAENIDLAADVALKLIRADVAEPVANERFLSEARLAARLKHPAIVSVFDFGKSSRDEPFIVMEMLQGESLGQKLARTGTLDPTELLRTLLPIVDALHLAHGHNVVHRDLKPDNIFIARSESGEIQPKLLDFGIAKLRGTSAFQATKLTQAGTLIGSPDYMSPEQARGEDDLDARSDVWALCVLAYECLVGKPPFHGDNYNALLWAIIHDEPVPCTVYQAGDSELWRILRKGFSKDRTSRWKDMKELGEAFAHWLDSNGVADDICHRSLQASWLPVESPTRPEMLAPFQPPLSSVPPVANSVPPTPDLSLEPDPRFSSTSHSALTTPTGSPARRPHKMSLWFAGVGLFALFGALIVSEKATPDHPLQPVSPPQEVKKLRAAASRPVVEASKPSAKEAPAQANEADSRQSEPSSATLKPGKRKSESRRAKSSARKKRNRAKTLRVRDLVEIKKPPPSPPAKPAPKKVRKRAAPKKPVKKKKIRDEFDFGI